jgi:hypothetical protein
MLLVLSNAAGLDGVWRAASGTRLRKIRPPRPLHHASLFLVGCGVCNCVLDQFVNFSCTPAEPIRSSIFQGISAPNPYLTNTGKSLRQVQYSQVAFLATECPFCNDERDTQGDPAAVDAPVMSSTPSEHQLGLGLL